MPADDLVLNVKQIAGYPNLGVEANDTLLMQRGGLGGAYLSVLTEQLVGQGLQDGGVLQVGAVAPADAVGGQVFGVGLALPTTGFLQWNAYLGTGNGSFSLAPGPAALFQYVPPLGWRFSVATATSTGEEIGWSDAQDVLTLSPTGYVTVGDQVLLARDPAAPLEAATAQYVAEVIAATPIVSSVNGRSGAVVLSVWDVPGAAPINSPRFTGQPRAATPPPWSCDSLLATTAFVHGSIVQYLTNFASEGVVTSFNGRMGAVVLQAADIEAAGAGVYAPIDSPAFTGYPSAPTAPQGTQDGQIATTAFVMNAVQDSTTGVVSFNGRTGIVTLAAADLTSAGGALLASPVFTGTPQAPTATPGTSSAQIASTAFVNAALTALTFAPLNSPAFTGIPTAPTAANTTNNNQIATTSFVQNVLTAIDSGVTTFNGRSGAVSLIGNDVSAAGGALLVSPVFTGTPQAPTAAPATNTGQLATCAFVMAALASVSVVSSFNGRAGAVTLTAADVSAAGGPYLPLSGGTLNGTLTGQAGYFQGVSAPNFALYGAAATNRALFGYTSAAPPTGGAGTRWVLTLGNSDPESGSNAGSNFTIGRYTDAGVWVDNPLTINRATGVVSVNSTLAAGGNVNAGGTLNGTQAVISAANAASNAILYLYNSAGAAVGNFYWLSASGQVGVNNIASSPQSAFFLDSGGNFWATGSIGVGPAGQVGGWLGRAGSGAGAGRDGWAHNFYWNNTNLSWWIGPTNIGNVSIASDYRIKKDDAPLPSMWERVKALNPIRYTLKDFTPPSANPAPRPVGPPFIKGDDVERWGFVAHELQDTLIEDAATGVKDAPDLVQSPNPWTVLAALTKALQEAMVRIEVLEAAA